MNVFEKYGVILKNKERFYTESLSERDYYLEGATPVYLMIDDNFISDHSWNGIVPKIANYLQKKSPKKLDELLEYRTNWSKTQVFSVEKKTNYSPIFNNLFINTNHTSLHSVWLIQDILNFYSIDKNGTYLLIKKPPAIEPKEIKEFVKGEIKNCFIEYLKNKKYDEFKIKKVVNGIELLNKYLFNISKSFNDFYLFDNPITLSNYKSRLLKDIRKYVNINERQMKTIKKYLDIYTIFCTDYFS